jgi:hemerythrin
MAFRWRDELATGITNVDNQHKELIKRTNDLLQQMKTGNASGEIFKTLDFLASYVVEHFADEEKVMKDYEYPLYKDHKQIHDDFVDSVKDLGKNLNNANNLSPFVIEVNKQVCDWLLNHILKQDKEMALYVKNHKKNVIFN